MAMGMTVGITTKLGLGLRSPTTTPAEALSGNILLEGDQSGIILLEGDQSGNLILEGNG